MRPKRRRILLATAASLIGATAAIPMVVSGTANAQAGSRICGRFYHSTDPAATIQEKVFRIYERPKADLAVCASATNGAGHTVHDSPFELINGSWNGEGVEIDTRVCEDFTKWDLGFVNGVRLKDDGPRKYDQKNICNNMERSDNVGDMNAYFLYKRSDENVWHFKRH